MSAHTDPVQVALWLIVACAMIPAGLALYSALDRAWHWTVPTLRGPGGLAHRAIAAVQHIVPRGDAHGSAVPAPVWIDTDTDREPF